MMRDDYKIIGLSFGSTSPVSNPQILPNHEASWPAAAEILGSSYDFLRILENS